MEKLPLKRANILSLCAFVLLVGFFYSKRCLTSWIALLAAQFDMINFGVYHLSSSTFTLLALTGIVCGTRGVFSSF